MSAPITVLVSEPDKMYCDLLSASFSSARRRFRVVASAHAAAGVLAPLQRGAPTVAIISASIQDGPRSGIHLLPAIRKAHPDIRILVTVSSSDPELVIESFRLGADGVFNRNDPFEPLCKSVDVLAQGQIWANVQQLRYVLAAFATSPRRVTVPPLVAKRITKWEAAVVSLAEEGLSNREIAEQLNLTEHTVKNYMFRVFEKLGVSNRVEVVLSCMRAEDGGNDERTIGDEEMAHPPQKLVACKF
jgi:DNA-binding NarL/FixJ family response regulator